MAGGWGCGMNTAAISEIRQAIEAAPEYAGPLGQNEIVLDPRNPYEAAGVILDRMAKEKGPLLRTDDQWFGHAGSHYRVIDNATFRAGVWRISSQAKKFGEDGEPVPLQPNSAMVSNFVDAAQAAANFPGGAEPPLWLDGRPEAPAKEVRAFSNILLHLPTGETMPHTPRLFNLSAAPFDYDPNATAPMWENFLLDLWPNDPESIETLQMWCGYCLGCDTSLQKILLMVGQKRSGKGTIARVLTAVLGKENVGGPTLASLSTNFGLAPLIGKQLAVISDARLSARADQAAIAERLLSVSGEDYVTVDRKHRSAWTGRLSARFMILSNELPRLADSSGALASRFIVLTLKRSFYGREDHGLERKLMAELPGISNWCIEGWRQVQKRGLIETPESAQTAVAELEDLGSPVGAFVRDRCIVEPGRQVSAADVWQAWQDWCREQGRDYTGTRQTFSRDLRAAVAGLEITNPLRTASGRTRFYEGIDLAQ